MCLQAAKYEKLRNSLCIREGTRKKPELMSMYLIPHWDDLNQLSSSELRDLLYT